jgi:protein-S-isoprenylcysteine O-methyltransferase Ste14
MPTEHHTEGHHHRNRHLAERFEGMLGILMVAAVILLAVGMVYGIMTTDNSIPAWARNAGL